MVQECKKRAPHQGGKGNAPNRFLRQKPDKGADTDKPLDLLTLLHSELSNLPPTPQNHK